MLIQAEDHQRVRVREHALVEREPLPGLIDALVDGHGVPRDLARELLEANEGEVEELERPRDALLEHLRGVLERLYTGHATRRTSVMVEKRLSSTVTSWFASQG